MRVQRLIGAVRILFAALYFPVVTFATCVASAVLLDFWHENPWRYEYAWVALIVLPAATYISAVTGLRGFGACGAFGSDPVADFRDVVRRVLCKHALSAAGFLLPQLIVSVSTDLSKFILLASLLSAWNTVFPSEHVNQVIADRARFENRSRFMEGIGTSRRVRSTKGIRRK